MDEAERAMSTAERLLAQAEAEKKHDSLTKEQIEELKGVINRIFSSPDGKFFWKYLKRALKVNVIDTKIDPLSLAGEKAMKNVYLSIVALMEADVKQNLEGGL